ncbi:hypothetical protein V1478_011617 [Vespula squamosa]|uniref:Uncharacterized protein n=1 Tax=Vespula squamosa TaxID=30214 RepID=A0ABD2AF06_VESSQ
MAQQNDVNSTKIEELGRLWRFPWIFVDGYVDIIKQTRKRIVVLIKPIQDVQDDINKMIQDNNVSNPDVINEVDSFLKETRDIYNTIKDVDNLETVLEEYKYHCNKNEVIIICIINESIILFLMLKIISNIKASMTNNSNGLDDETEIVHNIDGLNHINKIFFFKFEIDKYKRNLMIYYL